MVPSGMVIQLFVTSLWFCYMICNSASVISKKSFEDIELGMQMNSSEELKIS